MVVAVEDPQVRLQASKARLLEFLSLHDKDGLNYHRLDGYISTPELPKLPTTRRGLRPYTDLGKTLPSLLKEGLIEQREVVTDQSSNRYFITAAGKTYLSEVKQTATTSETGYRQDWAASLSSPNAQEAVADLLRQQPEFRGNEARVQELSQGIVSLLDQGKSSARLG